MKIAAIISYLFITCSLLSCFNKNESQTNTLRIDTTKAIRINGYWAIPKPSFDFKNSAENTKDTLRLVTCSKFVYSPLGKLESRNAIQKSPLSRFSIKDSIIKSKYDTSTYHFLNIKQAN